MIDAPKFAYVTVLWSPSQNDPTSIIADAIVLGESLRRCKSKHDKILLATSDLMQHASASALRKFWEIREIEHLVVGDVHLSCDPRFSNVLTKLQVLTLIEYQKIVLLDSDIVVRRNVDELFDIPAPAGMMRGPLDHKPDWVRDPKTYRKGGINGGVVVLKPDFNEFMQLSKILRGKAATSPKWFRVLKQSKGPEQDLLSHWYGASKGQLRGLHPKYNYQLHQLLFHPDIDNDRMRPIRYLLTMAFRLVHSLLLNLFALLS